MKITFAAGKIVRANQSTYQGSPVTAVVESRELKYFPYGSNVTNSAPSTLFVDKADGTKYYLAKPFSAVIAALSAITTTDGSVSLL